MRLGKRRGQFQILGALILIILMVQVRFMVIREYSPTLHEAAGDVELTQSELKHIIITSLAYASNEGDTNMTNTNFKTSLNSLMADMSISHFELALTAVSTSASVHMPPSPNGIGYGYDTCSAEITVESQEPISTWSYNMQTYRVDQKIGAANSTRTLPGLLRVVIPLNLTWTMTLNDQSLYNQPDVWQATTIQYNGTDYSAALVNNKGDGRMILEVSIPYSGQGTYIIRAETWDANNVLVVAAFDLPVD